MNKVKFILVFIICSTGYFATSQVIAVDNGGDGTWDDTNTYTTPNIPDNINEDVSFSNNVGAVELETGQSYTVGNISTANGNTITVNGTLNVGNSSVSKNYTSGNSGTLNVNGTVVIWGNLNVNNNYILNVTGVLIIKGDINLNNNANLTINGDVTVDGNFVGGNNTAIDIDGNMDVGGDFEVGGGSTATGTGTISYGGTCDDSASGVCASGPLPVELALFNVRSELNRVIIEWTTATEENNDYFTIERSTNGIDFEFVANVNGNGNSTQAISYHYVDNSPLYGRSYYRLKQTDFDGANETFKSKSIYRSNVNDLVIQPNPVQRGSKLSVYTGAAEGENVELSIFTASGINIVTKQIASSTEIDIQSDLEPGLYVVKVKSGTNQLVKRLLIK